MYFPIMNAKRMTAPPSIAQFLTPSSLNGYDMPRQILGWQRIKSHDTKLTQVLYVENRNAFGITSKYIVYISSKKIDRILIHLFSKLITLYWTLLPRIRTHSRFFRKR